MLIPKKEGFNPFAFTALKPESEINQETRKFFSNSTDANLLVKHKNPKANIKFGYQKVLKICMATTVFFLILIFQLARQFSLAPGSVSKVDIKIEVADIPPTEQFRRPPPPPKPSIPIPTEDESVPEDLTIASTEIDLSDIPPPPAPLDEDEELPMFIAYDEAPQIIGGMAALQKHLKYPRLAQKAGIEGTVFVKVLVGVDGRTEKVEVLKAKPKNMGFEESAIVAIKKIRWEPAKQRDRKIRVWVSIPVRFELISS